MMNGPLTILSAPLLTRNFAEVNVAHGRETRPLTPLAFFLSDFFLISDFCAFFGGEKFQHVCVGRSVPTTRVRGNGRECLVGP
jgi:hypothetical protein